MSSLLICQLRFISFYCVQNERFPVSNRLKFPYEIHFHSWWMSIEQTFIPKNWFKINVNNKGKVLIKKRYSHVWGSVKWDIRIVNRFLIVWELLMFSNKKWKNKGWNHVLPSWESKYIMRVLIIPLLNRSYLLWNLHVWYTKSSLIPFSLARNSPISTVSA